jgi:hypothetical protein
VLGEAYQLLLLLLLLLLGKKVIKVKISLLQAVEAPRVARGRGFHIT